MSLIQPQQEFVIPRNQCVPNSNNTFPPQLHKSLMIRDLCVGRIVFLPRSSRGIDNVRCILSHSPCLNPELDPMAYDHFVMILDVFQQDDGQVKCYICLLTTKQVVQKYKRLDKRIPIKGFSARPKLSLEQVYLEQGSMPKQSFVRVSHVYEISFSLLKPIREESQAYYMRLLKESYYKLMQEFNLKPGVYEDTGSVIRFGATIRREDSGPSLNGPDSGELGTELPDRESSGFTSSSKLSQVLTILARPESQAILNYPGPQCGTTISALDPSSTKAYISTSPLRGSRIKQNSDKHENITSPSQLESSEMALLDSQPVPTNSSTPHNITIAPTHTPPQFPHLPHPPPLNLKKALNLLSTPLSRFPRHLLKAILFISTQPWGKLCLYSLFLLACYYTGTLKFGFLAIKGLDGWLATLGNWSAPRYVNVVRVLGGGLRFGGD
ncbi:uncharacterized protein Bfra_011587 [Botrytis fragariae]|uniref:Uncharacterized protein n=1 Tax=Botrytis fragariae TaxID=1964551 RepID=A0A8H6AKP8_9HELO|nr:uncharacterized protein Bfra_011587 [Botrytis fragariae]KAF5869045.1 hypothetical protein Bfra_011587 [Botrytis fragariae]